MMNDNRPVMQASPICVTSVRRIQGKADILLSSGDVITMPRAMLKERSYRAGVSFDPAAHESFMQQRAYAFALDKAVSLLAVRARTEHEIADTLRKCAYPESIIARVMSRLLEAGYLNDTGFAKSWAASRASKGLGTMRIRMELRQKGVEQAAIDEAVSSMDHDALLHGAQKAAQKAARGRDLSKNTERQKVLAALARRGYSYSISRQALQSILDDEA